MRRAGTSSPCVKMVTPRGTGQRRCDFLVLSRREPQLHDLLRRERFDELPRRALCSKAALVHHDKSITELFCFVHVVRRDDEGHTFLLEAIEAIPQQVSGLGIEPRCGLVEDEQVRI
jgi:hypothetical protein